MSETNTLAYFPTGPEIDMFYNIETKAQCYKTFYGCNLQIFTISWSDCPWQEFPTESNVCA